jgi:hypothetical protein
MLLVEDGAHPKVVGRRLGHSNIRITMDLYSYVMGLPRFSGVGEEPDVGLVSLLESFGTLVAQS